MTHGNDAGKTVDMKILVVEECPQVFEALNCLISQQTLPIEAVMCGTMEQAKAQLELEEADLFLAVVAQTLPDAPSGEAVELMLEQGVPTLVLCASTDDESYQRLLDCGVVDTVVTGLETYAQTAVELINRLYRNRFVRVLLAHACGDERARLRVQLERYNYAVVEAPDAEQALQVVRTQSDIQLLITDHVMPGMSAMALVQTIRCELDRPDLVIIALSASGCESLAAQCIHSGANDFLPVPFSYAQLHSRVIQNLNAVELQRKARRAASVDPLTGVCNRCALFEKGERVLQRAAQAEVPVTLAVLELNQFKQINACWGYDGGDVVLKAVADHLRSYLRRFLVARIGGDEFCLLLEGLDHAQAAQLLSRVCERAAQTRVTFGAENIQISINVGLVEYSEGSLSELIAAADSELRIAKESAQGRACSA